jgi:DNA-binding transcriptional MerR regulator
MASVTNHTEDELTVEQLAQRTGMTVRNIRAHQSRGLLPPPQVRARTGYYGPEHVARLELIREMQADGFNLTAIQRMLEGAPGASRELLGFKRAVTAPFETEEPEVLVRDELDARLGGEVSRKSLARAERLGVVRPLGPDSWEVPSPTLLRAAGQVIERGVSLDAALENLERVKRHAEGVARSFVRLYLEEVWRPFRAAGRPEERWPEVRRGVEELRPLASEALLAVFRLSMTHEVEEAFGRELERGRGRGR